jgi:hypothetical protein
MTLTLNKDFENNIACISPTMEKQKIGYIKKSKIEGMHVYLRNV